MHVRRSPDWVKGRSLALARAAVQKIRDDRRLLTVPRRNLERWKRTLRPWPKALQEWEELLESGEEAALAVLTEESERGERLRRSSPFAGVLTPEERKRLFDEYESRPA